MEVNEILLHLDNAAMTVTEDTMTYKYRNSIFEDGYNNFRQAYAVIKIRSSKVGVIQPDYNYIENIFAKELGYVVTNDLKNLGSRGDTWFTTGFVVT